jgi:MinD-like ATPase involved in chromosome partitioning or flagellar assembly
MSLIDKFLDPEKTSKAVIKDPYKVFEDVVKMTSGSGHARKVNYNIFYEVIAFYGVVEGVGTSTLVANTALALAETGLTICVIDTSILNPVQDILLNTPESVELDDGKEHLDWFDMPYTKKSPLHVSGYAKNISVLSFKGKKQRGIVDFLSTNDTESLVEIALTTLHGKFDLILIDCCHEMSAVNTTCLQQAQQVIQVWNDSPVCLANIENFITNAITLSCPLDKMRYVVFNRCCRDIIGNMDSVLTQYRCKKIAENYLSEELYLLAVNGKRLFEAESTDELVKIYTECIIKITLHILNIDLDENAPKGTITSNDIMDGKVEGTYHKELKDFNDKFAEEHPDVQIDTNPMGYELDEDVVIMENTTPEQVPTEFSGVMAEDDASEKEIKEMNKASKSKKKKSGLFGRGNK